MEMLIGVMHAIWDRSQVQKRSLKKAIDKERKKINEYGN